jgi:class 3 adenylate cyclase/tetratricopeptide (TPR) repeat protein
MQCSRCLQENPPGAKFCVECGTRFGGAPARGPSAAKFVAPERYTPKHLTERILTSKSALEGERKQVTVLFADMKGSMELLADHDPEEARQVLDPVLERMMEAVHRYDGTVNQIMGDGIMALFGAPLAHEDHGVRACYAALRMQDSVKRYAEEIQRTHGAPIQIRIGLHSGEVVVRTIGNDLRMDYTAVGQSTHIAARMEQAALPGSVLLTSATLRLAEGYVQVKPLGKLSVKGLAEPVEAYELTGAEAVRTRLQAAASRGLTRFVGRDAELEQLRGAWEQASAGHGQVVAVIGEPGVGKSRLFYEFARSRSPEPRLMVESGSVSYGKATAYLPIIDLLKAYFKIHDRDDHRAIREKVTGKLLALDDSLRSSVVAVLALLDTPSADTEWEKLDPLQHRQRTLDAVKRLFLRESQVQPLLVVFEDLHWVDSETQAVLNALVESLPLTRMLLLVNYRPEYHHEWGSRTYYTELRIDPLEPDSAENLLNALLGDDAALHPLKQLLAERTGGNPFFLEESVRAFVELGALVGTRGAYHPTGAITAIQVPSTVQPIIAARIDRLSAVHKQLLQAATVIGTGVPFALLQAIADLPDDELRHGLAYLQSAEFLYETSLFPEPEYTFKHALTHEVAYESLLHERRRSLHARIMQATERLYADRLAEHMERLSHHALRGEVWDKAVSYCYQAGAKAAAKSAHREAVARFTEALAALERLPQNGSVMKQALDLRFSLRTSLSPLGEFQRSFELLREAEAIATTLNDQARLARVFTFKALYFWSTGQQDRAIEAAEQALATAQSVGEKPAQVLANLFAGRARHARGDFALAIRLLDWVIAATDDDRANFLGMANLPSVSARTWLSWSLAERGDFAPAIIRSQEAVYIADAVDHLVSRIYGYMALGIVRLRKGELAVAISALQRAFHFSETQNLRVARVLVAGYLGRAYTLSNHSTDAIAILKEAVDDAVGMNFMVDQPLRLAHLGEAYLRAGRVEEASSVAQRALQGASDYNERRSEAWTRWLLGEIHSQRNDLESAEAHYRKAVTLASELGMAPLRAHCHLGLGREYGRTKKGEQAQEHLARAVDLYRSLEMPFWLEQAETALEGWK